LLLVVVPKETNAFQPLSGEAIGRRFENSFREPLYPKARASHIRLRRKRPKGFVGNKLEKEVSKKGLCSKEVDLHLIFSHGFAVLSRHHRFGGPSMEPGEYLPDSTEGIIRVENLPTPLCEARSRNYPRRTCPRCGRPCPRHSLGHRTLLEVGSPRRDRPRQLCVVYSKHRCRLCGLFFSADLSDLAPPGSHYTHRVIRLAVRLVAEDGLPYRAASWHLWRDHRVFVPFATLQNWVEAAGKKSGRPG